jgi:hypothetical protein
VCERRHARAEDVCGRCLPVASLPRLHPRTVEDVADLAARRPFVVVGRSSFTPFDLVRLSADETLWAARRRVDEDYGPAGFEALRVIDDRTGLIVYMPQAVAS